jgi:hypothetical protein
MLIRLGKMGHGIFTIAVLTAADWCCGAACGAEPGVANAEAHAAAEILKASGIRGGLIVHLGCGDGKQTAALRAKDSYLVQGLAAQAAHVIVCEQPKPKAEPAESAKKKERRAAKAKAGDEANATDKPATPPKEQPAAKKKAFNAGAQPDARVAYQWTQQVPIHVRGLVLADRTLFVAGPPDVVDEEASLKTFADPATQKKLAEQVAALEGKQGSLLLAVSATDGKQLTEFLLDSLPVFDGLAAAGERLYLATADGKVVCFGKP